MGDDNGRFQCPYCNSYDVARLYVATTGLDSCECSTCAARWDEDPASGRYRGRANSASVVTPRKR